MQFILLIETHLTTKLQRVSNDIEKGTILMKASDQMKNDLRTKDHILPRPFH